MFFFGRFGTKSESSSKTQDSSKKMEDEVPELDVLKNQEKPSIIPNFSNQNEKESNEELNFDSESDDDSENWGNGGVIQESLRKQMIIDQMQVQLEKKNQEIERMNSRIQELNDKLKKQTEAQKRNELTLALEAAQREETARKEMQQWKAKCQHLEAENKALIDKLTSIPASQVEDVNPNDRSTDSDVIMGDDAHDRQMQNSQEENENEDYDDEVIMETPTKYQRNIDEKNTNIVFPSLDVSSKQTNISSQVQQLENEIEKKNNYISQLENKVRELNQVADTSTVTFTEHGCGLNEKRSEIMNEIQQLFGNELRNFKLILESMIKETNDDISSQIHAFSVRTLFLETEKQVKSLFLDNKIFTTDKAREIFEQKTEIVEKFLDDTVQQLSKQFNGNLNDLDPILDESFDELVEIVQRIFHLVIEMKGLKMSFVVPAQDEEFSSELHSARNPAERAQISPKIAKTMKPGVIISDVDAWRAQICRKADVILQQIEKK